MGIEINRQLLETIQNQPGGSANPMLEALLSQMDPNRSSAALPTMQELLTQLESTNPTATAIAKYMLARQEAQNESDLVEDDEIEEETVYTAEAQQFTIENSEQVERIILRLEEVRELRVEVEQLKERNQTLAAALGACDLCWGEDAVCPVCHGGGEPGFRMPDIQLFAEWIAPTLRHFKPRKEVKETVSIINNWTDLFNLQR
jgi:hypothetical protein